MSALRQDGIGRIRPISSPAQVEVPDRDGDDHEIDFQLVRGVRVTGRVLDETTLEPPISHVTSPCGPTICGTARYYSFRPASEASDIFGSFADFDVAVDANMNLRSFIRPDGTFEFVVPPVPGVILIRLHTAWAYMPLVFDEVGDWDNRRRLQGHATYQRITRRDPNDGAQGGDCQTFDCMTGPIVLTDDDSRDSCRYAGVHAYRVINPGFGDVDPHYELRVSPGPIRKVIFVSSSGQRLNDVAVQGLLNMPVATGRGQAPVMIRFSGSEADVVAIDQDRVRELNAVTDDGMYYYSGEILAEDLSPCELVMHRAARASGRLLNRDGSPRDGFIPIIEYPDRPEWIFGEVLTEPASTNEHGDFEIHSIVPDTNFQIRFVDRHDPRSSRKSSTFTFDGIRPSADVDLGCLNAEN